jgi:DNA-binding GntR family transcriptional regulator
MTAGAAGRDHPIPAQAASPSTGAPRAEASTEGTKAPAGGTAVLADRMAAALVHREPGWRLPRRSALARRYNVSLTEIDAALNDLARRFLVRRLPDGQLYRASPADYWIPVEGAAGLGTRLDPMGGVITCLTRHVSRREAPQDVAWALRLPAGAPIRVIRCVWQSEGDPAAVSTAYLNGTLAEQDAESDHETGQDFLSFGSMPPALPAAVSVEMSPPQPSIARSLRLSPGHLVVTVTVRFDDPVTGEPAGLTIVMLKPELFRIAIETTETAVHTSLSPRASRLRRCRRQIHRRSRPERGRKIRGSTTEVSGRYVLITCGRPERVTAWTRTRVPGTLYRDAGPGRDRGGIHATACPIPPTQGTAPP